MTEPLAAGRRAAVIGGGVIGAGWAARFLLNGWDVAVFDPHPDIRVQVASVLDNARLSLPALADAPMPAEGNVTVAASIGEAVDSATWIQESVPEDLAIKLKTLATIHEHARAASIIASSTSGYKPGALAGDGLPVGRALVAHPFNPVYLLPVVEIVAAPGSDASFAERAANILTSIGMKPVRVRTEIDAHIADRLLEAVWREALWLINDDVATTAEIDEIMRCGFGLRWAQMGLFETYRLAGGEAGMAHFLRHFGPALKSPWTKLMDVPELTEHLVQKIAAQSDAQSGQYDIRELERIRDRNLVGILRSLKERDWGAGAVLNAYDRHLRGLAPPPTADSAGTPLRLLDAAVLPAWIDYNGHMTEYRYVQVFSDSCEALLRRVGMHDDYVAAGHSWYTAETHTQFFDEMGVNAPIYTTVQILSADGKRLHVFYRLHAAADDALLATLEAMYLHVHMASGKVVAADDDAARPLLDLASAHADLPTPQSAGRHVGQRNGD